MRIAIALKLRPFSHRPGTCCLIPFSTWEARIYPTKIRFQNLAMREERELTLSIQGPVKGFTIVQDLEKGRIEVFGKGYEGFFRYYITAGSLEFVKGETLPLDFIQKYELPPSKMRLSLGVHKKQDWELISRRSAMEEVLPFWIRLAQLIPEEAFPKKKMGTLALLEEPFTKQNAYSHFQNIFQVAFEGILSPRIADENFLGLIPEEKRGVSPIPLIHEGAKQIQELFFQEEEDLFHFLPKLPKEFHAGRLIYIKTSSGDQVDIEWTKKQIKKVIICPQTSRQIQLGLQKRIRSYRVRKNLRQKGEMRSSTQVIELKPGQTLFLDRFN